MIHAESIKAIQQLLHERGIQQGPNENSGNYIARGLGVSDSQAESFLEALHDGRTVEEARAIASIPDPALASGLLTEIARVIGTTLGQITHKLPKST